MRETDVIVCNKLPVRLPGFSIIIIDKKIARLAFVKKWLKKYKVIVVEAGEGLKTVSRFEEIAEKILIESAGASMRSISLVAVGGGSVGDFVGFLASVLKRGVNLIHIPSTWLAAIDSSHGGKTALNLAGVKNQMGTFYPASKVFLVKEILLSQPEVLAEQGVAELIKIAFINGGKLWRSISQGNSRSVSQFIFSNLAAAVEAKYKVVRKDPYEQTGHRHILNLGHTVGHFYEAHYNLSHGEAVGWGLRFSLDWSYQRRYMKKASFEKLSSLLNEFGFSKFKEAPVTQKQFIKYLSQDKKMVGPSRVRFIFICEPGEVLVKPVTLESITKFAKKRGEVR